jgi:hypothetical protein
MTRRTASRKRGRRPARARKPARAPAARPSPELGSAIRSIAAGRGSRRTSLADVRKALQKTPVTWSKEGELLFPQDRTALVIELDELIDRYGARALAGEFLAG